MNRLSSIAFTLVVFSMLLSGPRLLADEPVPLWDLTRPVPKAAELVTVAGVRFSVIKKYEYLSDGYRFLHGVAIVKHRAKLFASFANNKDEENTGREEARYCISEDDGKTWSAPTSIDPLGEPGAAISHGVFLVHGDSLWAFHGAFTGFLCDLHTRAYRWNDASSAWDFQGVTMAGDYWACQEALKMANGNWIMSGFRVGAADAANPQTPAVAISHGDDLMKWDVVTINAAPSKDLWGESTVILDGKRIVNIARFGAEAKALVATSDDYGRTWTMSMPSNLPMVTSKPYAGTLSTGQRYLIATTTADSGTRRSPLTIAVTRPGESIFSKIYMIRPAVFPEGPGESHPGAALSYPYAIESDGYLYVGFSNNGGNLGRVGKGRELANNNSAELAIIPVKKLRADP